MAIQELQQVQVYSNQILELVELQLKNDEDSLTQSDLQAVVDAIVYKIMIGKN